MNPDSMRYFAQARVMSAFLSALREHSLRAVGSGTKGMLRGRGDSSSEMSEAGIVVTGLKMVNNLLCQQPPAVLNTFCSQFVSGPSKIMDLVQALEYHYTISPTRVPDRTAFVHWRVMFLVCGGCELRDYHALRAHNMCLQTAGRLLGRLEANDSNVCETLTEVLRALHAILNKAQSGCPQTGSAPLHPLAAACATRALLALHGVAMTRIDTGTEEREGKKKKKKSTSKDKLCADLSPRLTEEELTCAIAAGHILLELDASASAWSATCIQDPIWCSQLAAALALTTADLCGRFTHNTADAGSSSRAGLDNAFDRGDLLTTLSVLSHLLQINPHTVEWLAPAFLPSTMPLTKVRDGYELDELQVQFGKIRALLIADYTDIREAVGHVVFALCGGQTAKFLQLCGVEFGGGYLANHNLLPTST